MPTNNLKEHKVAVEKETVIKEVGDQKMEKTTIRIFIASEGKTRSIVFTPKQFTKFKKDINEVKF